MEKFFITVAPLCFSAIGGSVLITSIFALLGKTDILMEFEYKHFPKKFTKTLARLESVFGIFLSCLFFFLASAFLFENPDKILLAFALLGILIIVYFIIYIILWFKKSKKN